MKIVLNLYSIHKHHYFDKSCSPPNSPYVMHGRGKLPNCVCKPALEIAYEVFGDYLELHKIFQKLLNNLLWSETKDDVKQFINSCHTC